MLLLLLIPATVAVTGNASAPPWYSEWPVVPHRAFRAQYLERAPPGTADDPYPGFELRNFTQKVESSIASVPLAASLHPGTHLLQPCSCRYLRVTTDRFLPRPMLALLLIATPPPSIPYAAGYVIGGPLQFRE